MILSVVLILFLFWFIIGAMIMVFFIFRGGEIILILDYGLLKGLISPRLGLRKEPIRLAPGLSLL